MNVYCFSLQCTIVFLTQPRVTCTLLAGMHNYALVRKGFWVVDAVLTQWQVIPVSTGKQRGTCPIAGELLTEIVSPLTPNPSGQCYSDTQIQPYQTDRKHHTMVTLFRARPVSSNDIK